jgi:hypothetical protein
MPEGYTPDKEFEIWMSFRDEVLDKGEKFQELYSLWAKYAPPGFIPLKRVEGGICNGQSNLDNLQIRISNRDLSNIIGKFSIIIDFQDPSDTSNPTWTDDLIKEAYMAFCKAVEEILIKRLGYDNFPLSVYNDPKEIYTTANY